MKKHQLITSAEATKLLKSVKSQRKHLKPQVGFSRRVSLCGVPSAYETMPVYKFKKDLLEVYNEIIPEDLEKIRNEAWILNFPIGTNLNVDHWDHHTNFDIITISLKDSQNFKVGGKALVLNAGEAVRFGLETPHKVLPVKEENTYMVFAVMKYLGNDPYDYLKRD